jgi:hypothetical protein
LFAQFCISIHAEPAGAVGSCPKQSEEPQAASGCSRRVN